MRSTIFILVLFIAFSSTAQEWSRVKVWLDPISTTLLQEHGVELDHGTIKPGVFVINDFDASTLKWMQKSGVRYEVLIDDVQDFYRTDRSESTRGSRVACGSETVDSVAVPSHFQLGSMGGFFTYAEFLQNLDSMHALYPDLITERAAIDTFLSHENRPIYFVKISDNASTNETEPELLYTSIHHAREPQSLSQLIFYMWYLLENYGSDDEVTDLVDETQMYFVPMINPDGYIYNETTEPNGGGMWRKNRRDNGNGTRGVDLNRNYGYGWGSDNFGSSPQSNSSTYRGPSAFSEPETRAIKWLCEQHEFGLALNYHSHGNYLIYPWGTGTQLTPDSNVFIALATEMTKYNNYIFGTGMETVGYSVNGDSDDWMYGEQTDKNKIFSMTPEVGNDNDGFWPTQSRIVPLAQENVHPNLTLAHVVGDYAVVSDASPAVVPLLNDSAKLSATRLGLQFNGPYSFSIEPVSANIQSVGGAVQLSSMNLAEETVISFPITLDASINAGEEVHYRLVASFNGKTYEEEVTRIYGEATSVISNSGNLDDFSQVGFWSTTTEDYYSPTVSITDSPNGEYYNEVTNALEYNRIIDLRQAQVGFLRFYAKWFIEGGWDYAQILASPVLEDDWQPLCGKYTVEGTSYQDPGNPVWDGFQSDWVLEEIDLNDYIGERIKIKFHLVSDAFVTYDGFYFDDLEFVSIIDGEINIPLDTGYVDTIGTNPPDTGTGLQQNRLERFELFPNPSNGVVHVKGATNNASVKVLNALGAIVQESSLSSRTIQLEGLRPGNYFVEITSEGRREIHRLVLLP